MSATPVSMGSPRGSQSGGGSRGSLPSTGGPGPKSGSGGGSIASGGGPSPKAGSGGGSIASAGGPSPKAGSGGGSIASAGGPSPKAGSGGGSIASAGGPGSKAGSVGSVPSAGGSGSKRGSRGSVPSAGGSGSKSGSRGSAPSAGGSGSKSGSLGSVPSAGGSGSKSGGGGSIVSEEEGRGYASYPGASRIPDHRTASYVSNYVRVSKMNDEVVESILREQVDNVVDTKERERKKQIDELAQRVENAEEKCQMVMNLLEGLTKDKGIAGKLAKFNPEAISCQLMRLDKRVWDMEKIVSDKKILKRGASVTSMGVHPPIDSMYAGMPPDEVINSLQQELNQLRKDVEKLNSLVCEYVKFKGSVSLDSFCKCMGEMEKIKNFLNYLTGGMFETGMWDSFDPNWLGNLRDQINEMRSYILRRDEMLEQELASAQAQIAKMDQELSDLIEKFHELPNPDPDPMEGVVRWIKNTQKNLEYLAKTVKKLVNDRDERHASISAILEQIEILKNIKANKEDMDDILSQKANEVDLLRKVSKDKFDEAIEALHRRLTDTIQRLEELEEALTKALEELLDLIDLKCDKDELPPLRDWIMENLNKLQDRICFLARMREDIEAAMAKKKLIRGATCVSCDHAVVMKCIEEGFIPKDGASAYHSMRPIMTFEMYKLRNKEKKLPKTKDTETKEEEKPEPQLADSIIGEGLRKLKCRKSAFKQLDNLCNRYCGGSHTTTTPAQRLSRKGHFLDLFSPKAIAICRKKEGEGDGEGEGEDKKGEKVEAAKAEGGKEGEEKMPVEGVLDEVLDAAIGKGSASQGEDDDPGTAIFDDIFDAAMDLAGA